MTVNPSVIANGFSESFNVSCGVEEGQMLFNAKYQFFLNGESTGPPRTSSYTLVPVTSTGNFTCNATQFTDLGIPIPSQMSPPVLAVVLGELLLRV